ncbi:sigma-w pathway protein ysdB [Desertibacillus haloalkaliphilus]|uniref:sigma-w pathway protein ysdB n=1 Tax=Desertibacillus haloalkaliphilus TaxID=1328930 RepID=UPI001C25D50A|nr:sigma-w pathway protein ysdB [Desertibacillus haloalkaliphilus]MBU8905129.1 sigma-w pathway protein ysdB [Desertibacillus haloalkaliphilus]
MVILFRILLLIAIIVLVYSAIKYLVNPKRKLELAHEKKQFFFHDDKKNVRKNFLITYKGVLFEGEKYLGTTENAFEVVSIYVWAKHPDKLQGLDRQDFYFIEKEIFIQYPNATIEWKSPIKEFLKHE